MLILTRKIGESILVGDNIRLVVLEIRGRQIRLGIEAPAGYCGPERGNRPAPLR